jgi:hypothetical protein
MATITSATSGNWAAGATWVGGVAPNYLTDIAVIASGHKVTIASSVTIPATTVGPPANGVSTTELEIASGVTVTLTGNLSINPGNNGSSATLTTITHQSGSTLNLQTFQLVATTGGNPAGSNYKSVCNGTSSSRINITGSTGSRINFQNYGNPNYTHSIIDWQYVNISGVDDGANTNWIQGKKGFKFDHVLIKNSAVFYLGSTLATYNFILQNSDFRTLTSRIGSYVAGSPLYIEYSAASGVESRVFIGNTAYGCTMVVQMPNGVIRESIFDGVTLVVQYTNNLLVTNCAFYANVDGQFAFTFYSGTTNAKVSDCLFNYDHNSHGTSASNGIDVYLKNSVITGSGGSADPLYGNWNPDWLVQNNLFLGETGTMMNGVAGKFSNNTFAMGSNQWIQEFTLPTNWISMTEMYNNLFVDRYTWPTRTFIDDRSTFTAGYPEFRSFQYIDYNAWVPNYDSQGGTLTKYSFSSTPQVSLTSFTGTKNDLRLTNSLLGSSEATFNIEIFDGASSPNTYRWNKNGGSWTIVSASTTWTLISPADNIYAIWGSTTGHTTGSWAFNYTFKTPGQSGFGSQDTALTLTPSQILFNDETRDINTYVDNVLGTTGSVRADWFVNGVKRNGFDRSGSTVAFNTGFDPTTTLSWVKAGWETTSITLATGGLDGSYIGAFVPIVPPPIGSNIWGRIFHSRIFK